MQRNICTSSIMEEVLWALTCHGMSEPRKKGKAALNMLAQEITSIM